MPSAINLVSILQTSGFIVDNLHEALKRSTTKILSTMEVGLFARSFAQIGPIFINLSMVAQNTFLEDRNIYRHDIRKNSTETQQLLVHGQTVSHYPLVPYLPR